MTVTQKAPSAECAVTCDIAAGFRPDPRTGRRRFVAIDAVPLSSEADSALRARAAALSNLPGGLDGLAWCEVSPDGRSIAAGTGAASAQAEGDDVHARIWPDWRRPDDIIDIPGAAGLVFRSRSVVQIFRASPSARSVARLLDLRYPDRPIDLPLVREGTLRVSDTGRWAGIMHDGALVTGVLPDMAHSGGDRTPPAPQVIPIDGSVNDLALLHDGDIIVITVETPQGTPDLRVISISAGAPVILFDRPGLIQPVWGRAATDALLIRTGGRGEHPIALLAVTREGTIRQEPVGFDPLRDHPVAISPSGARIAVRRYARPSGEHHALRPLRAGSAAPALSAGCDDTRPGADFDDAITPSVLEPRVLWLCWP